MCRRRRRRKRKIHAKTNEAVIEQNSRRPEFNSRSRAIYFKDLFFSDPSDKCMQALPSVVGTADIHVFRNRRPINDTSCSGEYIVSGLDYQVWKVPWAPSSVGDLS